MKEGEEGMELPPAPKIEQTPSTGNTTNSKGEISSGGSAPYRASHGGSGDTDEGMQEGHRTALTVSDRKRSYTDTYFFGAVSKRGSARSAGPSKKISGAPSPTSVHSLPIERVSSIEIAFGKNWTSAGSAEVSCERSSMGSAKDVDRASPPPFQRDGSSELLASGGVTGPLVREISDSSASASGPKAAKISGTTSSVSLKAQLRSKMDRDDCRSRRTKMGNSSEEESTMEEVEIQELIADGGAQGSSRRDDVSWLEQSYSAALRDDHEYLALPPLLS